MYDNNKLLIMDAALQAGVANEDLFPKRGKEVNYTVNGVAKVERGLQGESAVITMNGKPAGINTKLEPNSEIEICHHCGRGCHDHHRAVRGVPYIHHNIYCQRQENRMPAFC